MIRGELERIAGGKRQNRRKAGTRQKMTDSNSYDVVIGSESETDGERPS